MTSILVIRSQSHASNSNANISIAKTFCWIFFAFLKSTKNLKHSKNEGKPQTLSFEKNMDSERRHFLNAIKVPFQGTLFQSAVV